tara:strand:+ start:1786 stop:2277 length:492 start_codon:yes stop_codon:yes gene_type:complete
MSKKTEWAYLALVCLFAAATTHAGGHQAADSSVAAIKGALSSLGHKYSEYQDIQGEPHLVLESDIDGVEQIAVFFDDCHYTGYCEDITYYANYGEQSVSEGRLNGWNHIGAKNRSKAFTSNDGSVGISYTVSYIPTSDAAANATLAGLFLLEAELFAVALGMD